MRLARCFRRYVKSETSSIHRIIQRNVGTIKADDVPFAVKTSSDLLTEESYLYKRTVIILCSALGVFTLSGLVWHFCFYKKSLSPGPSDSEVVVVTSSKPRMTRDELRKQLKDDIAEFYATFRQQYLALRRKHIKQLKELRRLTNDNRSTDVRRMPEFSAIVLDRKGQYVVTKDVDVNSIFEGMDMTIFDK
ncbi:hypothetical protein OS493_001904 [Desmophyllum pertusum]|uniref:Uncharacterized protein n=1 Tax=Desmophyllum pertusum TaxID=174260 RepID=A0A9W9Z4Q5_9CNID|nr:hypothetical protein OS493_001904 [Desmophyllum pertusum]